MAKRGNIQGVVKAHLCCGCGACAAICPHAAVAIEEGGRYNFARVDKSKCADCGRCLSVCPSEWILAGNEQPYADRRDAGEHWLAHSSHDELRLGASSGGFATGLVAGLVSRRMATGAVMVTAEAARAFHNRTIVARSLAEVLSCRGSRYGPASACLGLKEVLREDGRYFFVGKGCEVLALRRMQIVEPALVARVPVALGIFCAQTPARDRTIEFLQRAGVDAGTVTRIDYRGGGWPGSFRATGSKGVLFEAPYARAWGFLAGGRPALRCFLCGDGAAAHADLSVGDPWGLPGDVAVGEGLSYAIARTDIGRDAIAQAALGGDVVVQMAPENWVRERGAVEGRRAQLAQRRLWTYRAVCQMKGITRAIATNGPAFLPTILVQAFRRNYY